MSSTNSTAHREVRILNRQGLHARPVMRFVDLASNFASTITVSKDEMMVDGKSPMEMMLLEATEGTVLHIVARGEDAQEAADRLVDLVNSKFDED